MNEKELIDLWNDKRKQLIKAQLHSVITIAVITVLAVMGYFESASPEAKFFALLFLGTIGGLGILTQFAVIREAKALANQLQTHKDLGAIAKQISVSGIYLNMTQVLMAVFSVALLIGFAILVL